MLWVLSPALKNKRKKEKKKGEMMTASTKLGFVQLINTLGYNALSYTLWKERKLILYFSTCFRRYKNLVGKSKVLYNMAKYNT